MDDEAALVGLLVALSLAGAIVLCQWAVYEHRMGKLKQELKNRKGICRGEDQDSRN